MEMVTVVIVAWAFVWGMLAGIKLAERRQRKSPIEALFEESVHDIRSVEKFAGLQCISRNIITEVDGSVWKMSIEREKA